MRDAAACTPMAAKDWAATIMALYLWLAIADYSEGEVGRVYNHDGGAPYRANCVLVDLDEGECGGGIDGGFDIAHTEQESEQHPETKKAVERGRNPHAVRNDMWSIVDLLGDMISSVGAWEKFHRGEKADEEGEALIVPSSKVRKCAEDFGG